jgi:hypothetical protein
MLDLKTVVALADMFTNRLAETATSGAAAAFERIAIWDTAVAEGEMFEALDPNFDVNGFLSMITYPPGEDD